jgi:putative transposase
MPSRNTIREYDAPAYYHVYNRGAGGGVIFKDSQDKRKFMSILERYLDEKNENYLTFNIELVAYCIMNNHYHLLLFQDNEPDEITKLMRSVSTAYSMYYNLRYKNKGHVFQSVFCASRITEESYLLHISRYIHLNPETYKTYRWSSLRYYMGSTPPDWIHPDRIIDTASEQYANFLEDYVDRRAVLKEIKEQLAI